MSKYQEAEEDEQTLMERHRMKVVGLAVLFLAGGGFAVFKLVSGHGSSAPPKPPNFTMVHIAPLPPPPPPPLPPPPPKQDPPPDQPKEKMVEQSPDLAKKEEPKPVDKPPDAPMGTALKGSGPSDGFNLGSGNGSGGGGGGDGNGRGGGGGSRWGPYAAQIQSSVSSALRGNSHTRSATLSVKARIWLDSSGRVTRAKLAGSTGDRDLDDVLSNQILMGLPPQEPPPQDMPMPIVMRITESKSH